MIVCPHCGWENPSEAAFCTNCGRGLAKARASRAGHSEDPASEGRSEVGRRRTQASAAKTTRDHDMPLLRLFAESAGAPESAPVEPALEVAPLDVDASPSESPGPEVEAEYIPTTDELEAVLPPIVPAEATVTAEAATVRTTPALAVTSVEPPTSPTKAAPTKAAPTEAAPTKAAPTEAPPTEAAPTEAPPTEAPPTEAALTEAALNVPRLRSPVSTRDATATLVDFRMPAAFAAEISLSGFSPPAASPPVLALPTNPPPLPAALEPEVIDAEEFPGLLVDLSPALPSDTARPGGSPTLSVVRGATPPVAEILPLSSLSPRSPLRVARIIEPIDGGDELDEDFEIPSSPHGEVIDLKEDSDFDADPGELHSIPSVPGVAVDLESLDDVDLDNRIDDADEVEDISVSDVADLEGSATEGETLRSGEMEIVRPDAPRAAPPPLREMEARFLLRPLSNNMAESRLIAISDRGLSIGRSEADVCLAEDPYLSPRHLQFTVQHDTLFAEDLGSANGSWVRVRSQIELKPGDLFRVAHQLFRLELVPARGGARELADGTRRFGADRDASLLCLQQLGDDGQPRNCYHLVEQGARIGRHIADIVFTDDTFMSGTHAVVLPRGERAVLRDLSSRNGTWVRLAGRQHVGAGDALMLGQTVWRISRPVT